MIPVDLPRHAIAVHVRLIMAVRLAAPREGIDGREKHSRETRRTLGEVIPDDRAIVIGAEIIGEDVEDVILLLAREVADDADFEVGSAG